MDKNCLSRVDYAALIPCYENGNAVKAISMNGEITIINKSIKSVIKSIQRTNNIDPVCLRQNYGKYVGRKNNIPLPINFENILIPIKSRKTIGINDGSFGYVNLLAISEVYECKGAVIKLSCNMTIESLESKKAVTRRIELAQLIRERFMATVLRGSSIKEAVIDVTNEYEKPATKGDIAILARELMFIKSKISGK